MFSRKLNVKEYFNFYTVDEHQCGIYILSFIRLCVKMSRWYALEPDLSTDTASVSCNVGEFLDSWFTTNF